MTNLETLLLAMLGNKGGGGEGGTTNYNELDNRPQINGITLTGNKDSEDLNLVDINMIGASYGIAALDGEGKVPESQLPPYPNYDTEIQNINKALDDKVNETELSYITGLTRKNLLSLETIVKTETGTVKFVVSAFDGTIRAVGTAGASASILEIKNAVINEPVIISTGNSEASESGCFMDVYDSNWTNRTVVANTEVSRNKVGIIRVIVAANATVDITLKPMVRKASITDSTFEPYRVSLQEQVDDSKTNLLSTIVASSNASASNAKTLDFQGTGKNLEKLVLEGKTEQNGTPSPSNPIEVKGVGNKCNNIFDYTKWADAWSTVHSGTVSKDASGFTLTATANDCYTNSYKYTSCIIEGFTIGKTYTLSWKSNNSIGGYVYVFDGNNNIIANANNSSAKSITFTASETSIQLRFGVISSGASIRYYDIKIEEGSTATKFYPYDKLNMYEIPISVGGKTSNIYLDQPLFNKETLDTEKTVVNRSYKKMVFDGTNTGASVTTSSSHSVYRIYVTDMKLHGGADGFCDRFVSAVTTGTEGAVTFSKSSDTTATLAFTFPDSLGLYTIEAMNAWFAANPTTVYYPLATETKELFDVPEISTVVGKNTLSVDTDVTPSKVEVTSFGEYYSKAEVDKMLKDKDTGWIKADGADANVSSESDIRYRVINNVIYVRGTFKLTSIPSSKTIVLATTPYKPELSAVEYICSMDSNYNFNMAGRVLFQASSGRVILQFSSTDKTPLVNTEYSLPMLVVPM